MSTEELFEVNSKETLLEYIVNLAAQTCSCRNWQFTVYMPFTFANLKGYPCGHALAIILGQHKQIKDYVKPCFTLESFKNTYAGAIIHPHNIDFAMPLQLNAAIFDDDSTSESEPERTLPPNTKRQPGRPRKRRIRTATEKTDDSEGAKRTRLQKCGRCREQGHSARTCKEKI